MGTKINQIITALFELEAKGCHLVSFDYADGVMRVRIFKGKIAAETIIYEGNVTVEPADALLDFIDNLKRRILTTVFQCYKRKLVRGKGWGKWKPTRPVIEFGEKATTVWVNGSGYIINDPENRMQYFVDMNELSDTDKKQ